MKKYINRIIALSLSALMLIGTSPAMAASIGSVSDDKTIGSDTVQGASTSYRDMGEGSSKTDVYLTVDDSNIITGVPTSIIVSGKANDNGENIGMYSVKASGDIAGNKELTITPKSESVVLTQKGKNDVTAHISQEKTTFSSDELANGASSTGKVTASLSAGSWSGSTEFIISLDTVPVLNGYTTLYQYDLSATEKDDVKAYYMVPNKNTTPIEIETNNSTTGNISLLSSFSNLFKPITAYAAGNEVIEYNGIKYELSNEDTLVISGNGEMKENIQADLIDYDGIRKSVCQKFNVSLYVPFEKTDLSKCPMIQVDFRTNSIYPQNIIGINEDGSTYRTQELLDMFQEIYSYIDEIKSEYIVSMPTKVILQDGVTNVSKKAFFNCQSIQEVELADSVTAIGQSAFQNCGSLKKVTMSDKLTDIGIQAFYNCSKLSDISIPNSVIKISSQAFYKCNALTEIMIPDSVTTLGSGVFSECYKLKEVTLSGNLKQIPNMAFYRCLNLKTIKIPDSVNKIEKDALTLLADDSIIYCQSQAAANLLNSNNYSTSRSTVVVEPSMFD